MKLTQKQETFTLNLFKGMSQREAYIQAVYSPNALQSTRDRNASALANSNKVLTRFNELRQKAEDESIALPKERKQRLTEFVREDIESDKGVPLRHSNILATQELNKMEKIYSNGATVNVDNRTLNIIVNSDKAKELTEKLIEGERTE